MNTGILGSSQDLIVTFFASFLIWLMFAGIIALWFVDKKFKWRQVFYIFFASFVAWGFSEMTKKIFPTLRPFEVGRGIPLTLTIPTDSSFPSGHASMAFSLAIGMRKYSKKVFFLYIIFATLIGLGRVLGHVHYYIDIIAGAGIGILTVLLLEKISTAKLLRMKIF
jgi:undecaprenyl-diphosphatase